MESEQHTESAPARIPTTMQTFSVQVVMEGVICPHCGIAFALPLDFAESLTADGEPFWCPNGCRLNRTTPKCFGVQRTPDGKHVGPPDANGVGVGRWPMESAKGQGDSEKV